MNNPRCYKYSVAKQYLLPHTLSAVPSGLAFCAYQHSDPLLHPMHEGKQLSLSQIYQVFYMNFEFPSEP